MTQITNVTQTDFLVKRGYTFPIHFIVKKDGSPEDITNRSYPMVIRQRSNQIAIVERELAKSEPTEGVVLDWLTPEETSLIDPSQIYDLEVAEIDGDNVNFIFGGQISSSEDARLAQ